MRLVSFAEFYAACRDRLTDGQLRTLDPGSAYGELDGCWAGWREEADGIWLSIVVGEVKGLQRLKQAILASGVRYVGWTCRKDGPAYAWGRYWKGLIDDAGIRYPDGEIAWRVRVDLARQQRQPVKKEMVEATEKV